MKRLTPAHLNYLVVTALLIFTLAFLAAQNPRFLVVDIPKTWDLKEIKRFHLPPPDTSVEVTYASEEYYNSLPEHVIYKTYPMYVREKAPEGYLDSLRSLEPEISFDLGKIKTQEDWVKAGEVVFHSPINLGRPIEDSVPSLTMEFIEAVNGKLTPEGIHPYSHHVVKEKGQVVSGDLSCATCHTRVMEDGSLIVGGQGTFEFDPGFSYVVKKFGIPTAFTQEGSMKLSYTPWAPELEEIIMDIDSMEFANMLFAHVPGVMVRQGVSFTHTEDAVAIPSLIGVKDIRYLDKTGLMLHENPGDMMRYAAFNQGMDMVTSYDGFIPMGTNDYTELPKPEEWDHPFGYNGLRYTDAQLYALTQYIYSLKPPENPHSFDKATLTRGEQVFKE